MYLSNKFAKYDATCQAFQWNRCYVLTDSHMGPSYLLWKPCPSVQMKTLFHCDGNQQGDRCTRSICQNPSSIQALFWPGWNVKMQLAKVSRWRDFMQHIKIICPWSRTLHHWRYPSWFQFPRQHWHVQAIKLPQPPAALKKHTDMAEFKKTQAYQIDKW